jgi:SPP1 family predicted phage head-tail adaptor
MSIGQMRTRLFVQEPVEERTADGGVVEAWRPLGPIWGRVQGLRGRELFSAQQVNPQMSHKILTGRHRLVSQDGQRVFNIESVNDIGDRHHKMELACVEVIDG